MGLIERIQADRAEKRVIGGASAFPECLSHGVTAHMQLTADGRHGQALGMDTGRGW